MDYFIVELSQQQKIAIPLNEVKEVMSINYTDICPIPGVKNSLLGIISQRGSLLWLLDLSQLLHDFQLLTNKFHSLTILVTKIEENYIGLVVKKLGEIRQCLEINDLTNLSDLNISVNYYQGVIPDTKNSIPILNLTKIKDYLT
ncbi:chemotaxis protein CheW [Geminocystis sp.]|uniref:chemotaxis protein CheW n=1 Tax=Geminocystis sp. TaxID=2664100 RepID=UPI003593E693